jgi:hypothetical protein
LCNETKHGLKVFQNRMLRRAFGRQELEEGKKSVNEGELPVLILHITSQVPLVRSQLLSVDFSLT